MIRHVVTWKLKQENKAENAQEIKNRLCALVGKIEEIKFLEVGINENGGEYEVILITSFESFDDLKTYDTHPEHQKVRDFVKSVVVDRVAVDYEIK
ncbi:MAG: Dabb family protein [Clostridia bacterium]|nr:Dabb family protein [Clostridia bacterium]